ncbi:MAG: glutamate-cysteine ligase family protein, partial [Desulfobulbaceae bacterium]|nr:glutamate-cysteine ligase family protein [Desulfobulbaceae bacterium]
YDDGEFAKLHAAIRLVLPILPALAASTPIMDGKLTGFQDSRLEVYRFNQKKIPLATGEVIPEKVYSRQEYEDVILQPLYRAVAPHDPDGIMQEEWLNSRGAIARFERNTVEIRVLDIQECPRADLSLLFFITAIIRDLMSRDGEDFILQRGFEVEPLADILKQCIRSAQDAVIGNRDYLRLFGVEAPEVTAGELLSSLKERLLPEDSMWSGTVDHILRKGTLSKRIIQSVDGDFRHERLKEVYGELCRCLERGELFEP